MITTSVPSIIVSAANANFSAHTYTEIYASSAATPVINGVSVSMAAGSSLNIMINSLSNGTNCFLLGDKKDVFLGSTNLI
jgi:hypothetical protein